MHGHLPLGCTLYGISRWSLGGWEVEGVCPVLTRQGWAACRMGAKATAAAKQAALVALKQQIGMPHREALLWARALTLHHTWLVLSRWGRKERGAATP